MVDINYERIPAHMQPGAQRYIEDGIKPGGFLYAVLTNNLKAVFGQADETNKAHLQDWVYWLHWDIPSDSQGSEAKVDAWIKRGGLKGMNPEGSQ